MDSREGHIWNFQVSWMCLEWFASDQVISGQANHPVGHPLMCKWFEWWDHKTPCDTSAVHLWSDHNRTYRNAMYEQGFRFFTPTFAGGEEAVHVDAAAWVWYRQGAAGYESLLRWGALGGSHQTPARSIARALQHLHRLSRVHTQLTRRTRNKVLQHHRVFTAARELQ